MWCGCQGVAVRHDRGPELRGLTTPWPDPRQVEQDHPTGILANLNGLVRTQQGLWLILGDGPWLDPLAFAACGCSGRVTEDRDESTKEERRIV